MKIFYHGTSALLPFPRFDPRQIGSGMGGDFGGFFFTDSKRNAEFYAEALLCTVEIADLVPTTGEHMPTVMERAVSDGRNYVVADVLDGPKVSTIAAVPAANVDDIHITGWFLAVDEAIYHEALFDLFDVEDALDECERVEDVLGMMGIDLDDMLEFAPFRSFYERLA